LEGFGREGSGSAGPIRPPGAQLLLANTLANLRPAGAKMGGGDNAEARPVLTVRSGFDCQVRQTTIPNDSGAISGCFDHDAKLLHCEIAQPSSGRSLRQGTGAWDALIGPLRPQIGLRRESSGPKTSCTQSPRAKFKLRSIPDPGRNRAKTSISEGQ
jgi:hypothetical protein